MDQVRRINTAVLLQGQPGEEQMSGDFFWQKSDFLPNKNVQHDFRSGKGCKGTKNKNLCSSQPASELQSPAVDVIGP